MNVARRKEAGKGREGSAPLLAKLPTEEIRTHAEPLTRLAAKLPAGRGPPGEGGGLGRGQREQVPAGVQKGEAASE